MLPTVRATRTRDGRQFNKLGDEDALVAWGESTADIEVRETGVYEPTHWMVLPDPP